MANVGNAGSYARQRRPKWLEYKASFALALAVSMLLVAGIPLLIVSALSLNLTSRAMRDSVNAEVITLRNASAATARSFLTDQESLLLVITASPRLQEPSDKVKQDLLATYRRIHPAFHWLGFYTPDGRLLASSNGRLARQSPSHSAAVQAGRQGLHVTEAQPAFDDPNLPVILYSAPVRASGGQVLGVVLVEVDLHALIQNLQQLRIRESGETYFIRDDGMLITASRFTQGAELHQRIESLGFLEARAGREGLASYADYRGVPVIGAYAPFPVSERAVDPPRWILLSELDLSEAMTPVRRAEGIIIGVFLVLGGLTTVAVSVICRQVTTPLRSLRRASAEIARGHWDRRVNEDAPYEFRRLASSFNRMAAEVQSAVEKLRDSNDALQAVQDRFKLVVTNAPVFLFSVDPDGVFTFAEGQALSHFAGEEHPWVGRHISDALREAPAFASSLNKALAGELERDEIQQGDGVYQIWYSVFRDDRGNVLRVTGLAVDLTERKKLEALLAVAQRIAHLGSWELDLVTHRVTWSTELYRIFGIQPDEFPGTVEAFLDFVHPDDRERIERTLQRAIAERIPYDVEYRIIRTDGEVRTLHSSGEFTANHSPRAYGTAHDITEQKRTQEALRRTLTQLNAQQEASLDGVLMVDDRLNVSSYNQRFMEIWKIPETLLKEGSDVRLLEAAKPLIKDPEAFIERVMTLYANPLETSLEEIELKDGRVLERYTAPVISPDGTFFGRIWRFHDLTERRSLENQLRKQYSKLLELDQMKSDFVNAVSHDLRTPLTSILGYAEFLEEGISGPLNPDQLAYVVQILKSSRRLEGMVSDLLDFARMEAGTFKLSLEDADLVNTMEEVAESMRPQIEDSGLTLQFDLPPAVPCLRVDAERMQRVFANLLSNAIKFTPRGGRICLRARVDDGCFVGEVADTGTGIAQEDIPRLFHRFSQLDAGRRQKGGTGLGLSISKTIIEAHGGSIGVESQLGVGSTFWFKLPVNGVSPETPDGTQG